VITGDRVRSEGEYEQRPDEQCCERRERQRQASPRPAGSRVRSWRPGAGQLIVRLSC
jgi:hypothetical protein